MTAGPFTELRPWVVMAIGVVYLWTRSSYFDYVDVNGAVIVGGFCVLLFERGRNIGTRTAAGSSAFNITGIGAILVFTESQVLGEFGENSEKLIWLVIGPEQPACQDRAVAGSAGLGERVLVSATRSSGAGSRVPWSPRAPRLVVAQS
jgi:hypothetical protein